MIIGFRESWLKTFFLTGAEDRQIPPMIRKRLFRKLQMMDDAVGVNDLSVPPGNRLERLRGHLSGYYSIRVTDRWRLIFIWDEDRAGVYDLYLDDHSYR